MVLRGQPRGEQGAVAIIVAVMTTVLFILSAFVIDLGQARTERREAQNTADAAALAGGNVLFPTGSTTPDYAAAEAAAKAYAEDNVPYTIDWASCSDSAALPIASGTNCISFQKTGTTARVRVHLPTRNVSTGFARVIGVDSIAVTAAARATLDIGGASDCGLCVLGDGMLHDVQNGDVTVSGANIHFNGNVSVSSNGLVATSGDITVEGTATGPMSSYNPDPNVGVPPIQDPLADWLSAPPSYGPGPLSDPCTQGPGRYGAKNFPNGTCTLLPGTYVVTGLWDFGGNASLAGNGVTLYFTCGTATLPRPCASPGEAGGRLDFAGNGTMTITAPLSGDLEGMAIWYDRMNTSELRLTGNGMNAYSGTIYAPSAKYRFNGNGCGYPQNALIIVKTLELNGTNACLTANYTQGSNVQIPPGELHLDQ
ncbi:hypothetical protein Pve01_89480 [Planomonospora venezuelensis]|nr:hypothetical protein Pve01_89480 [Planomonospora venezuelensis]